jgi:hypothetical protein
MLSPDQSRHVATSRNERLPGKAVGPYTIGAQQPFILTVTRTGIELGTRKLEGYWLWLIDWHYSGICLIEQRETTEHLCQSSRHFNAIFMTCFAVSSPAAQ